MSGESLRSGEHLCRKEMRVCYRKHRRGKSARQLKRRDLTTVFRISRRLPHNSVLIIKLIIKESRPRFQRQRGGAASETAAGCTARQQGENRQPDVLRVGARKKRQLNCGGGGHLAAIGRAALGRNSSLNTPGRGGFESPSLVSLIICKGLPF